MAYEARTIEQDEEQGWLLRSPTHAAKARHGWGTRCAGRFRVSRFDWAVRGMACEAKGPRLKPLLEGDCFSGA
jgi:hypothetical protein